MFVYLNCPSCQTRGLLPRDVLEGRKYRCKKCKTIIEASEDTYDYHVVSGFGNDFTLKLERTLDSSAAELKLAGIAVTGRERIDEEARKSLNMLALRKEGRFVYASDSSGKPTAGAGFFFLRGGGLLQVPLLSEGLAKLAETSRADLREAAMLQEAASKARRKNRGYHQFETIEKELSRLAEVFRTSDWDGLRAKLYDEEKNPMWGEIKDELADLEVENIALVDLNFPTEGVAVLKSKWTYATDEGSSESDVGIIWTRDDEGWKVAYWDDDPAQVARKLRESFHC
ncbi:MAG: hypothetical protein NUW37_09080 [Planctomycetes bacterium]|nr:hypothetical protein [Planctomycetota bacterium]